MAGGTRQRRWIVLAAVLCGLLGARALSAAQNPRKPVESVLPANTIMMLSFPDLGATQERAKGTALYQIWSDPGVQAYLKPALDAANKALAQGREQFTQGTGLTVDDIKLLLDGPFTIAVTGLAITPQGPLPQVVVLLAPKDTGHLKMVLDKVLATLPPDMAAKMSKLQIAGVEVTMLEGGPMPVYWGFVGDTFVLAAGENLIESVVMAEAQSATAETPARLKDDPIFAATTARLAATRDEWLVYLNAEPLRATFQGMAPPLVMAVMTAVGLDEIKAVAQGASFRGPAVEDGLFLYVPQAVGPIASLIRPEPVNMELLSDVPQDAARVTIMRANAPLLLGHIFNLFGRFAPQPYQQFRQGMAEFEQQVGFSIEKDLVANLGNEVIAYQWPLPPLPAGSDAAVLVPGMEQANLNTAYLVTLADPVRVQDALNKLTDFAVKMSTPPPAAPGAPPQPMQDTLQVQAIPHGDAMIRAITVTEKGMPLPFTPSYCIANNVLVFGLTPDAVKKAVNQIWRQKPSFVDSPVMAEARPHVPAGAGLVAVGDLRPSVESGIRGAVAMVRRMPIPPGELPPEVMAMLGQDPQPLIDALQRNLFTSVLAAKADPDGVMLSGFSPFGGTTGIVAVTVAVGGGGIALPALAKARETARKSVDMSNLRQVGLGVMMYAGTHGGALPESLDALVDDKTLPDARVLVSPQDDSPAADGGKHPTSYRYVGALPANVMEAGTIIAYAKPGIYADGSTVLFYDGHVEWVPASMLPMRLQDSLNTLTQAAQKAGVTLDQARLDAFYGSPIPAARAPDVPPPAPAPMPSEPATSAAPAP